MDDGGKEGGGVQTEAKRAKEGWAMKRQRERERETERERERQRWVGGGVKRQRETCRE